MGWGAYTSSRLVGRGALVLVSALILGGPTAATEAHGAGRDQAASTDLVQGGKGSAAPAARTAKKDEGKDKGRDEDRGRGNDDEDDDDGPQPSAPEGGTPGEPEAPSPGPDPAEPADEDGGDDDPSPDPPACDDADRQPDRHRLARARAAVQCLIGLHRAFWGLPPLAFERALRDAGARHARDMVRRSYFAHEDRRGGHVARRVRRTRWFPDTGRWLLGETLAWGRGTRATPRAIVDALMASPTHRDVLLHPGLREIGVGAAYGTPRERRESGITYAIVLGHREHGAPRAKRSGKGRKARRSGRSRRR